MRDRKEQFNMEFPTGGKSALQSIVDEFNKGKGRYDHKVSIKGILMVGTYQLIKNKYPEVASKFRDSLDHELIKKLHVKESADINVQLNQVHDLFEGIKKSLANID
jgi:hypothetical protein